MKKLLAAVLLPLALIACAVPGTLGSAAVVTSPAPLANAVQLRQGLNTTWHAFDLSIDAINLLRKVGVIKDGSARARTIADLNDRTRAALLAAGHAIDAGSATDYQAAISDAAAALAQLQTAVKGS